MLDDFAKRLKELRSSKNMTMGEFGDLGDVSATTQGTYEREDPDDRRYPDVRYLYNLKNHGIDIHYLLTGEKSPEDVISAEAMEIIRAYESADDNHKAIFEATAKACAVKPKGRVDKKKDDDQPKGGSRHKSGDIIADGGSIGDIIQGDNNIKSTIHNYQPPTVDDLKELKEYERVTNKKRNDKIKKTHQRYKQIEMIIKQIIFLLSACLAAFLAKEIVSVPANTEIEQFASLFFMITIPSIVGILTYKEISNIVTKGFDDIRETTKNRILLETI
ncbi:helix-turn-helix domain-containing protein [Ignatzschineria rhizosphaerae]|uniref:Helix-turn-helix domain-containing protein n=1 Tax=Ignatzschineria rhizosphaerae TaxID=2923279 RepID=A0ABY3X1L0_9GAMM|nr:helix-turn-helix domain-containing protein [Ignatzschineria rhizosphaerae]UNM96746.1 helix-turn-helix domain-containing protein [Ignatzschineria rhizosphaerae]